METEFGEQINVSHYKDLNIEPIDYIQANGLDFIEGNVVKYISRHKRKNKDEDIKKVIDYAVLCLKHTYGYSDEDVIKYLTNKYTPF